MGEGGVGVRDGVSAAVRFGVTVVDSGPRKSSTVPVISRDRAEVTPRLTRNVREAGARLRSALANSESVANDSQEPLHSINTGPSPLKEYAKRMPSSLVQ